jgi:glycine cleavage system aminomethyltransferase T
MFATQRPNRINEAITNETTELVCFRLQGANALRVVMEMGAPAEVDSLPPGGWVARDLRRGGSLRGSLW